ncbi:hypothetical protein BJX70DRAFT_150797 [Aspergillus crustosus]
MTLIAQRVEASARMKAVTRAKPDRRTPRLNGRPGNRSTRYRLSRWERGLWFGLADSMNQRLYHGSDLDLRLGYGFLGDDCVLFDVLVVWLFGSVALFPFISTLIIIIIIINIINIILILISPSGSQKSSSPARIFLSVSVISASSAQIAGPNRRLLTLTSTPCPNSTPTTFLSRKCTA